MSAAASEFGPFDGRVWLNTTHQGPLPQPAVRAAGEAAALKVAPHRICDDDFTEVPERLRGLLAELAGARRQPLRKRGQVREEVRRGPRTGTTALSW